MFHGGEGLLARLLVFCFDSLLFSEARGSAAALPDGPFGLPGSAAEDEDEEEEDEDDDDRVFVPPLVPFPSLSPALLLRAGEDGSEAAEDCIVACELWDAWLRCAWRARKAMYLSLRGGRWAK
jgi:hypothetical protein